MLESSPLLESTHGMISWWEPQVGTAERLMIQQVLDGQFLNDGAVTAEFEQVLAEQLGSRYVVSVTSGTMALFVALKAVGVGPGDEVIVPDLTFIATANAVMLCGATPVAVDIEPDRLMMDPDGVEAAITSRTRAIVPVHISGRAAKMAELMDLAQRHELLVVEDAAEAFLSRTNGRALGSIGHCGCFSFSPMKMVQTGQGGAIATDDPEIHRKLILLKDQGRPMRGTGGDDLHECVGFNFKFTNLQAAVGLAQMNHVQDRLDRVRRHYEIYRSELEAIEEVRVLPFDLNTGECPLWVDCLAQQRDALIAALEKQYIDCRPFWHPLHRQAPYRREAGDFPVSAELSQRAMWLPSAYTLEDEQIQCVCDAIRGFYAR